MPRPSTTVPAAGGVDAPLPPPPPYSGIDINQPTPPTVNRPRLPEDKRNPYLPDLTEDATIVKFQTIVREQKEIVIGRIKVQTPGRSTHAFILRRYDTNAVSLTTMYKVAFPGSSDEDEKREMDWVRSSYDTRDTNGGSESDAVRLAGQWVPRNLAIHLAPAYGIADLVLALSRAEPDPSVSYRKSQRSQQAADELARSRGTPVASTEATRPRAAPSMTAPDAAAPPSKRARRTAAAEAPVPAAAAAAAAAAAEEPTRLTLEATTTVTAPVGANIDMNAEIESAKQLVRDLKRELQMRTTAGDEVEETGGAQAEGSRGAKRGQDEEGATVPSGSTRKERVIKTNKRVEGTTVVKVVRNTAYGAMIFGLGVGAAFLPRVFEMAANYL